MWRWYLTTHITSTTTRFTGHKVRRYTHLNGTVLRMVNPHSFLYSSHLLPINFVEHYNS